MFVRIDKDLSVNIGNIFSYKLLDEGDSYKLQIWANSGNIVHNIFYLKDVPEQMKILIEFNNVMRDLTTNLDVIRPVANDMIEELQEEKPKHIAEQISIDEII